MILSLRNLSTSKFQRITNPPIFIKTNFWQTPSSCFFPEIFWDEHSLKTYFGIFQNNKIWPKFHKNLVYFFCSKRCGPKRWHILKLIQIQSIYLAVKSKLIKNRISNYEIYALQTFKITIFQEKQMYTNKSLNCVEKIIFNTRYFDPDAFSFLLTYIFSGDPNSGNEKTRLSKTGLIFVYPSLDRSIGSTSACYHGGRGFKSQQGWGFL